MSTQDTTLPPPCGWPTMLELFIEASATLIRQAQAAECNEHNYEQLLSAVQRVTDYGQQGLSALTKQARAAIAAQAQQPAAVKESLTPQQAQQAQGVPEATLTAASLAAMAAYPKGHLWDSLDAAVCKRAADLLAAAPQAEPSHGKPITAQRALYFMERFKHEEKLLGPNEQAALDFVIAMLAAPQAEPQPEREPLSPGDVHRIAKTTGAEHSVCNGYWPHRFALAIQSELADRWGIKLAGIGTKGGDKP